MKKRFVAGTAVLLAAALTFAQLPAGAAFSTASAVHVDAKTIESSTLAVGAHLIYLGALTQQIWDIAQQSAQESGQDKLYYKSELADGTWFNISGAESIRDISTEGQPVTDAVVDALYFTHHTKSDGVTYDLRTGEAVLVFEIISPYGTDSYPELEPLRQQYDFIAAQGDGGDNKEKRKLLREVLDSKDTQGNDRYGNEDTKEVDRQMQALQTYYEMLHSGNAPSDQLAAVSAVQEALDAARRAVVCGLLYDAAANLAHIIESDGDLKFTDLAGPASDTLLNLTDSRTKWEGKMLAEGESILTAVRYELSRRLISAADGEDWAACDEAVLRLTALGRIEEGNPIDTASELSLLEESLLPKAQPAFLGAVSGGENSGYRAAVSQKAAEVQRKAIRESYGAALGTALNELEFFIDARLLRLENPQGQSWLQTLIAEAAAVRTVPDSFQPHADARLQEYKAWLDAKLQKKITAEQGPSEADQLESQIAGLEAQKRAALDANDLMAAKSADGQISRLLAEKDGLQQAAEQALAQTQAKISELQAQAAKAAALPLEAGEAAALSEACAALDGPLSTTDSAVRKLLMDKENGSVPDTEIDLRALLELLARLKEMLAKLAGAQADLSAALQGLNALLSDLAQLQTQLQSLANVESGAALLDPLRQLDAAANGLQTLCEGLQARAGEAAGPASTELASLLQKQSAQLAGLGSGTAADIGRIKQEALAAVNGGTPPSEALDALAALIEDHPALGVSAVEEILGAMTAQRDQNAKTEFDGAVSLAEQLLQENKDAYDAAVKPDVPGESELDLWPPGDFSDLTEHERQAAELLALHLLGATRQKLEEQAGQAAGNPLVFLKFSAPEGQYAPISGVAALSGTRYVWEQGRRTAVLAEGPEARTFTQGSAKVTRVTQEAEMMAVSAKFRAELFLPAEYLERTYRLRVSPLGDTAYAVLYHKRIEQAARTLCGQTNSG